MEKGYNSNIVLGGERFHVQTEDWGMGNPFIVSRIYKRGAVVKSLKTPYAEILLGGPQSSELAIRTAVRDQHQKILDQLVSGQLL